MKKILLLLSALVLAGCSHRAPIILNQPSPTALASSLQKSDSYVKKAEKDLASIKHTVNPGTGQPDPELAALQGDLQAAQQEQEDAEEQFNDYKTDSDKQLAALKKEVSDARSQIEADQKKLDQEQANEAFANWCERGCIAAVIFLIAAAGLIVLRVILKVVGPAIITACPWSAPLVWFFSLV